jgi:hypothetical protein
MDPIQITILILQIATLFTTFLTPIIIAIKEFMGRVQHSKCFRGEIDLTPTLPTPHEEYTPTAPINIINPQNRIL